MCGRRQPTLAGELESFRGLEVLWTTQAQPHRRHVTVYSSQDWTPGLGLQSHSCPGCCLSPHQKVQEVGFGWCEGSSGAVSPPPSSCALARPPLPGQQLRPAGVCPPLSSTSLSGSALSPPP